MILQNSGIICIECGRM